MFKKISELLRKKEDLEKYTMEKILKKVISKSPKNVPVLNVVIDHYPIATLFYDKDKENYGLIYYEKFKHYKGMMPFNIDLPPDESVEIGTIYYSPKLWYPFSARLPNKNRKDCVKKLKEHNLTLEDHPLKILSYMGRISIADLWRLEPYYL